MRFMGIDYGTVRIGIALSDPDGRFALPHKVVKTSGRAVEAIRKICVSENVNKIVLGESKDYKGIDNPVMRNIREFKTKLETETGLPVEFEPEILTSAEAERIQGHHKMLDASAAALILKSYIDRKRAGTGTQPTNSQPQ